MTKDGSTGSAKPVRNALHSRTEQAFERLSTYENALQQDALLRKSMGLNDSADKVPVSGQWRVVVDAPTSPKRKSGTAPPLDSQQQQADDSKKRRGHSYTVKKGGTKVSSVRKTNLPWQETGEKQPKFKGYPVAVAGGDAGLVRTTTSLREIVHSRERQPQSPTRKAASAKVDNLASGEELVLDNQPDASILEQSISGSAVSGEDKAAPALTIPKPHFFPLEFFDDGSLESADIESIVQNVSHEQPLDVKSIWRLADGGQVWKDCQLLEYESGEGTFLIQWPESGKQKWAQRLAVLLPGDSEEVIERRRAIARKHRSWVESEARFDHAVEQMSLDNVAQLPQEQFKRTIQRTGLPLTSSDLKQHTELVREIVDGFGIASNRAHRVLEQGERELEDCSGTHPIVESAISQGKLLPSNAFHPDNLTWQLDRAETLLLEVGASADDARSTIASIPTGAKFGEPIVKQVSQSVADVSCWLRPSMMDTIAKIRELIHKVKDVSLIHVPSEPVSVEELGKLMADEREEGIIVLRENIIDMMGDVVLGQWTAEESAYEAQLIAEAEEKHQPPPVGQPALPDSVRARFQRVVHLAGVMLRTAIRELLSAQIKAYEARLLGMCRTDSEREEALTLPEDLTPLCISVGEPRPFLVQTILLEGNISADPGVDTVLKAALEAVTATVSAVNAIPQFAVEVIECGPITPNVDALPQEDLTVTSAVQNISAAVADAFAGASAVAQCISKYEALVSLDVDAIVAGVNEGAGREAFRSAINDLREQSLQLQRAVPARVFTGCFAVDSAALLAQLTRGSEEAVAKLAAVLAEQTRKGCLKVAEEYAQLQERINEVPEDPEQLFQLQEFVKEAPQQVELLKERVTGLEADLGVMQEFGFDVPGDAFTSFWTAVSWPQKVMEAISAAEPRQEDGKMKFMGELQKAQSDFSVELESIEEAIKKLSEESDLTRAEELSETVLVLQGRLEDAASQAQVINSREKLFEFSETEFDDIDRLKMDFEPFSQLWSMAGEVNSAYPEWNYGPFLDLDSEQLDKDVNRFWKLCYKLEKTFDGREGPQKAAGEMKAKLDDFKKHLPLITALRTPGLRDRHWEQLSQEIQTDLRPDKSLTLTYLLEMKVDEHEGIVTQIAEVAAKEFSFERALEKMKTEWDGYAFECLAYRDSGTFVLKGVDEVTILLDDQIVKVQAMRGSPFVKPLEKQVLEWNSFLVTMQETLDEWLKCQKTWLYLEPIFSSPDIMRQMPTEGRRFSAVDKMWRTTMATAAEDSRVLAVMRQEKLLDNFIEANKLLDLVQKGLNDYLETKRSAFPRFYFLSNDELLDILAETKDPKRVVPHLPKCFEAITDVDFQSNLDITSMISGEKEKVELAEPVRPDSDANRGSVEKWLIDMERVMRSSLTKITYDAIRAYAKTKRTEFVIDWPGQVVLAVDCFDWTAMVEQAISEGGARALKGVEKKLQSDLDDIVMLVRGDLPAIARLTLGAMVVIDVHDRDIVTELIKEGISDINEFEWSAQLRYYEENDVIIVRQVNAAIDYGYEYIGNSPRLVITPLTDRCYRTLMGAMHLYLGGAPQGPAGTGKTETTKDLSKAVAKQCVVFNCSDGLDYLAMAKFFKGLASCGAWACFDEFNRIELEVLSVVAQQILAIQQGIKQKIKRFVFEGSEIALDPSCAIFITMNPGYAGRSELPDNLKALFRPCAMMIPNYAMIAEIVLYSFGYTDARNLARKVVYSLRLSSEQLSSQDHYDFGMRAVKSILTAAGQLKRVMPDEPEDLLCLRAINDVNLPKFVEADLPLFSGITSDLFLGMKVPEPDHSVLLGGIKQAADEMNIEATDTLMRKSIQLYDTVSVRHGLMVVGLTMSMKTACINVLSRGMTLADGFPTVKLTTMNPKSISYGQLYGMFDPSTREWVEGIGAYFVRYAANDQSDDKNWVIFDGPVDAIWIESMNTVLDDNKKLCLTSGEIIKLSNNMTMIFEPEDLSVASPATVSRCGMVFMEPQMLEWTSLVWSWMNNVPEHAERIKDPLNKLFQHFIPPLIKLVRRKCKEFVVTKDSELVASLLRLLGSQLSSLFSEDATKRPGSSDIPKLLDGTFLFSLIWSVGASSDAAGRKLFEETLKGLLTSEGAPKITVPPPDKASIYDQVFDLSRLKWLGWLETIPNFGIAPGTEFSDIIVPTIDTATYSYLLEQLATNGHHVLFVGPTGTGKSVMVIEKLMSGLPEAYIPHFMNFSAQTSANQTQDIIDGKVDKRRKGVYGPPLGCKLVIFVDDLNMPAKETYGAQPPIELLRQWMDHKGWYDRKEIAFRQLIDIQFVTAMGPPGGGRTAITCRYSRHFNTVSLTPFTAQSLSRIFTTILEWYIKGGTGAPATCAAQIVQATISVFNTVAEELLPTPDKSHYTFNLRDLSKVVQGIMMSPPDRVDSADTAFKLWIHESKRIFQDRLINDTDRTWFHELQGKVSMEVFKKPLDALIGDGCNGKGLIMYSDFITKNPDPMKRPYEWVESMEDTIKIATDYLEDYNAMTNKPMNLVLFGYVIEHLCRISRIIRQPRGHALLIGVGGSGRQSATRLAAAISDCSLVQIEITKNYDKNAWADDLKAMFQKSGASNTRTVFLFNDTQIVLDSMLEDINNILNTGEVPNLFPQDELNQIIDAVMPRAREAKRASTPADIYKFFVDTCRRNLHIVLAMSPVGDALRNRLRQFPSLVNCCTIDWFAPWPAEGLIAVAGQFLAEMEIKDDIRKPVIEQCMGFQQGVRELSGRFLTQLRRHNYVTPTSYLELISTFKNLLGKKASEVGTLRDRYDVGLSKLLECADNVATMQDELSALQPVLVTKTKEVEDLLVTLEKDQAQAAVMKEKCEAEEKVATAKAAEAAEMKASCEADLAEALPALEAATNALKSLTKADITEVKAMKNPPGGVRLVMEGVCIMLEVKPDRVDAPDKKGKVNDYWKPAQKLLADGNFMNNLLNYDKDHIPAKVIQAIRPYVQNPEFDPKVIEKVSKAANGLCKWVRAMEVYDRVAKEVEPKREQLAVAEAALKEMMDALNEKKAALKEVEDRLAELQAQFKQANDEKESLAIQVDTCEKKLVRAEKLISGLGGERARWKESVERLSKDLTNVTGDVLISSAVVAYLGVFTGDFRDDAIKMWVQELQKRGIPCSDVVTLSNVLGDPVKIREWQIAGLPRDTVSTDNAIVMNQSRRWPLLIDPQGQANKWIRNMEKDSGLHVLKMTQSDFIRKLENAVQFGQPVLLENVGESLDTILEPLLTKSIYKSGGAMVVNIGDSAVEYSPDFRFYITTKLPNPHYPPEVSTKVVLINFTITLSGLEDQLLGITVERERRELEDERQKLIIQNAAFKKELKEIEDKILEMLSSASGDILEDEALIETLSSSKKTSEGIAAALEVAEATEAKINDTRAKYRPVAVRGSLLFFCISDLRNVEPMYQYSLVWFVNLFVLAIQDAEASDDIAVRVDNLIDYFTKLLYRNVCRSLFEKDKLLYSFLNTLRIQGHAGLVDPDELRLLLTGGSMLDQGGAPAKPADWVPERAWTEIINLSKLPAFSSILIEFTKNLDGWQTVYDASEPHKVPLPASLDEKYKSFSKLCIMRCLRPDCVVPAVREFIVEQMGQEFVEPPPFDLASCYADSSTTSPLIFVLSPGADPMASLLAFADTQDMSKKIKSLSLGQGQGPIAEKMINDAIDDGSWVVLQNCHLAPSWMPTLERICEQISPERAHPAFRLWLTSYPSNKFPVAVLQDGIKITNEPPKGLRANVIGTYYNTSQSYFDDCKKKKDLEALHFGLAFFHASIQERRKFGALGWNIAYEFNESDLRICQQQLQMFLNDFDIIPWKALQYTAGETNYGGRVTDDFDRRTLMTMLRNFYKSEAVDTGFEYSESGIYALPSDTSISGIQAYLQTLPYNDPPEVYGLHDNANITSARNETYSMFETMLTLQPRDTGGSGQSAEDMLEAQALDILQRLPANFDVLTAQEKYPTSYEESMNTVLTQELSRFNNIIVVVRTSLQSLVKAVKGLVVMSSELEGVATAVGNGQIPAMWAAKSYPSLKPLGSYVSDLIQRIAFFQQWIDEGPPPIFWLSGFFFTQSFLTGTLQNYARKHKLAIDTLRYSFEVVLEKPGGKAEDGCYVDGLFLDGAAWHMTDNVLTEQAPKILFTPVPTIWLKPCLEADFVLKDGDYTCPVYKTSERKGTLSTTGHSTNFVLTIVLPSKKNEDHWVRRGVAMLCQLDD